MIFLFRRLLTLGAESCRSPSRHYLAAYAFGEYFTFTGPVQSALRSLFGFQTPRDYWFPDIRSTGGAALVMVSVLYPYVYLTTRAVFILQRPQHGWKWPARLAARPLRVLLRCPVAGGAAGDRGRRGTSFLMETLNDIGASTLSGCAHAEPPPSFTTWLNRGSLEGARRSPC